MPLPSSKQCPVLPPLATSHHGPSVTSPSTKTYYLYTYGPADATAIPEPHHLLPYLNPDGFYLSGTGLPTQVVVEKRPLNGCSSSSSSSVCSMYVTECGKVSVAVRRVQQCRGTVHVTPTSTPLPLAHSSCNTAICYSSRWICSQRY